MKKIITNIVIGVLLGLMCGLLLDVGLAFLLGFRLPLFVYISLMAFGALLTPRALLHHSPQQQLVTICAALAISALCMAGLLQKSSQRHINTCERILGLSPITSPFPLKTITCEQLNTCVNEHPYSFEQEKSVERLMEQHGCPAP